MCKRNQQRGVTLVEVAVSTVMVGVVLVASLETLGSAMRTTRATTVGVDAYTLLESMLAETQSVPFEDPDGNTSGLGIESGEPATPSDRLAFDDLDDFEWFEITPPVDRAGVAVPGYDGWTQRFRVLYANDEVTTGIEVPNIGFDKGLRRVVCIAWDPDGVQYRLNAFRSRHGPSEEPAPFDATRVTAAGVQITVGSADPLYKAVGLSNLAEDPTP